GSLPRDTDPGRLALALLAAVQGGLLLARAQHATDALEAALDTVIAHIRDHAAEPPGAEASTGPRTPGPGKRPAVAASCPGHGAWLLPGLQRAGPRRRAGADLL